jgi:MFS family permease
VAWLILHISDLWRAAAEWHRARLQRARGPGIPAAAGAGEDFPKAVAWNSSIFQAATIAGPVVGGLLYGWTASPATLVYICAAIEYLAALAVLAGIRVRAAQGRRPAASYAMALEGLRYIRRNKLILGAISLDLFAVLLGGAVALLPVYAREILKIGASGLGILRSAPGVGAVIMALVVARWPLQRHAGAIMLWCVCGFGVFTVVFGLSRNRRSRWRRWR